MPEYDLEALSHPDHGPVVVGNVHCTGCGYTLTGLPLNGVCPECGRPVELSLRGELLRFASPAYVRSVNLGLSIILTAILLYAVLLVANIFIGLAARNTGTKFTGLNLLIQGLALLPSALFILGYWKFTVPDPGFTGRERPASARNIARIAACISAAAKLGSLVSSMAGAAAGAVPLALFAGMFRLIDFAAWATLFFSITLYVRWVARRIPDEPVISQTRTFIWLLPVLATVGFLFICLGPIIALILYATMLQTLHVRTREVLDWQVRGGRYLNP